MRSSLCEFSRGTQSRSSGGESTIFVYRRYPQRPPHKFIVVYTLSGSDDPWIGRKIVRITFAAVQFLQTQILGIQPAGYLQIFPKLNRKIIINPGDIRKLGRRKTSPIQFANLINNLIANTFSIPSALACNFSITLQNDLVHRIVLTNWREPNVQIKRKVLSQALGNQTPSCPTTADVVDLISLEGAESRGRPKFVIFLMRLESIMVKAGSIVTVDKPSRLDVTDLTYLCISFSNLFGSRYVLLERKRSPETEPPLQSAPGAGWMADRQSMAVKTASPETTCRRNIARTAICNPPTRCGVRDGGVYSR